MAFTPEELQQIANKKSGDQIRSTDWNVVVDEVQELGEQKQTIEAQTQNLDQQAQSLDSRVQDLNGQVENLTEQTQELDNTKINRSGDTVDGNLTINNGVTNWRHPDGQLGGSTNAGRTPSGAYTLDFKSNGGFAFAPGVEPGSTNQITQDQISRSVFITPNGVGIGTTQPSAGLEVSYSQRGTEESVLDLRVVNRSRSTLGQLSSYVRFLAQEETHGRIRSGGSSGVVYEGRTGDYAEWLPRLQDEELIEAGDVVGIFGGKVSKLTQDAHRIMAITDRAIVLGNMPESGQEHLYEQVSFIGQVPIKVRGMVQAGDYIIPSGQNDGVGVAVSPDQMTPEQCTQIVGQAWESSNDPEVKRVNAAVGLDWSSVVATCCMSEIAALRAEMQALKQERSIAHV